MRVTDSASCDPADPGKDTCFRKRFIHRIVKGIYSPSSSLQDGVNAGWCDPQQPEEIQMNEQVFPGVNLCNERASVASKVVSGLPETAVAPWPGLPCSERVCPDMDRLNLQPSPAEAWCQLSCEAEQLCGRCSDAELKAESAA